MIQALIIIPFVGGLCTLVFRKAKEGALIMLFTALAHLLITAILCINPSKIIPGSMVGLDQTGLVFLCVTSLLFAAVSVYAAAYVLKSKTYDSIESSKTFGCMQLFLASMSLVTISRHFGLLWVAIEATTLATAPLIYLHRSRHSLEAAWKYLIICSVGIGLALLGNIFIAVASEGQIGEGSLMMEGLLRSGSGLNASWLKAAFIFFLVGYGTKMGLAPFHTWLPDAHSDAPAFVSALLSGTLLNCAFLGLLRLLEICVLAGLGDFCRNLLLIFGILSVFIAGIFIIGQKDYKRMLAYSSVENMGILAFGLGIGGSAIFGSMLHMINHSLIKGMLFMVAGNIYAIYGSRQTDDVSGIMKKAPFSGTLWLLGFTAVCGLPPFGLFISKLIILRAAFNSGNIWPASLLLFFIALAVSGMSALFIETSFGKSKNGENGALSTGEPGIFHGITGAVLVATPAFLCILSLVLGVNIPPFLSHVLKSISLSLGGAG